MEERNAGKILKVKDMNKCIGCYSCMLTCARTVHGDFSPVSSGIRIRSCGGIQGKFVADVCRGCTEPSCADTCMNGALQPRNGGGVKYYKERCIGCRLCIDACSIHGISFDEQEKKAIVCIQCGSCARNCPHGVLSMEVR